LNLIYKKRSEIATGQKILQAIMKLKHKNLFAKLERGT